MVDDSAAEGEQGRVEAAGLMGEIDAPEFSKHLGKLIRQDESDWVIRAAVASAGKRKYPGVVRDIILRLGRKVTKAGAREALIQYGDIAVKGLSRALFDPDISRDIRLNIPRTLSKIHSQ